MSDTVDVTYPFTGVPVPEAMTRIRAIHADRPMTKMTFPYGGEAWVVHRHAAAKELLESRDFVRQPYRNRDVPYFVRFPEFLKTTMQFMDPPDHTRMRRLVAKAFTMRRVQSMRPRTEAIAQQLLDAMEAGGTRTADVVSGYALPLPIQVLSELLGVPAEDRDRFIYWSTATLATSGMTTEQIVESTTSLSRYLSELIARRRAEPADDLLSALAKAKEADDSLSDEEILTMGMLLIVGGFDNTANFIGRGILALLLHSEQKEAFMADMAGTSETLVNELLRHWPMIIGAPVSTDRVFVPFIATKDVEIGGVLIRAGESIMVDPILANHDPEAFENPEKFDIRRQHNPQLTFSHGLHHCLGASLARMEVEVALTAIFTRFPSLALDGAPRYASEHLTAGFRSLPVRW